MNRMDRIYVHLTHMPSIRSSIHLATAPGTMARGCGQPPRYLWAELPATGAKIDWGATPRAKLWGSLGAWHEDLWSYIHQNLNIQSLNIWKNQNLNIEKEIYRPLQLIYHVLFYYILKNK